jgi:hypothetical protein
MREALTAALRKQIVIIKRQAEVMQEQLDHAQTLLALLDPEQEVLPLAEGAGEGKAESGKRQAEMGGAESAEACLSMPVPDSALDAVVKLRTFLPHELRGDRDAIEALLLRKDGLVPKAELTERLLRLRNGVGEHPGLRPLVDELTKALGL